MTHLSEPVDLAAVPRARALIETVLVDGEAVVHEAGAVHRLSPTATLVWQSCDGSVSVGELAAELADVFGADPTSVQLDVIAVVSDLAARGLVAIDGEPSSSGAARALPVLQPPRGCAGCGDGPAFARHVLVRVGPVVVSVGADEEVADAIETAFSELVVGRVDDPQETPVYGLVLPSGPRSPGMLPLSRLHRGPQVLLRSRRPERVARALVAQLSTHVEARAPLHAVAVGRPGSVVLVPMPANPVAYERAVEAAGLRMADLPVARVGADPPNILVGAVDLDVSLSPLLEVASRRLHLGPEPEPLPWGAHEIVAIGVPGAPSAASVLAELGPDRCDGLDVNPAVAVLLALARTVPVVRGTEPQILAGALDEARG